MIRKNLIPLLFAAVFFVIGVAATVSCADAFQEGLFGLGVIFGVIAAVLFWITYALLGVLGDGK